MGAKRTKARPGEGEKLRGEILRAADALLAEEGTDEALTLRAVARRTGVSTPSVYAHFPSRDALLEAVCLRVWDDLARRMHEHTAEVGDPMRALSRCARVYARFALDHPVQYRVLLMRPSGGSSPGAVACFRYLADATAACVREGILRGEPEVLAMGLWSAMHGCVSLLIAQPGFDWPEELIDSVIRMAGLGTALACRVPWDALPPSAELAAELDELAAGWATARGRTG
ncbi:TetR/AcrR family transcriptional regulator [Amycolatopsis alba]|uniref:TetR/AcrR family transcriptional regulator n=1 Tax=Amycolatopsis alba DSM 44262 TaxID=1125972 RepID=A0A229S374_AMYAL|nr:TetR/AcrR family transcriptional regulator [Amycolatopsis alba]OXM53169.1 TetR/AcrR family transcriptional regulator [Amycolatopsis alba DSM 44262]